MVPIEKLISRFYISSNILYWKNGRRKDKPAGYPLKGYILVSFTLNGRRHSIQAHQIIFAIHHGYIPKLIDHKDRNPNNNSKENLREATSQINSINTGMFSHNTSGYKGVSWSQGKWVAKIVFNQKQIHLGIFNKIEDAVSARLAAEEKLWHDLR